MPLGFFGCYKKCNLFSFRLESRYGVQALHAENQPAKIGLEGTQTHLLDRLMLSRFASLSRFCSYMAYLTVNEVDSQGKNYLFFEHGGAKTLTLQKESCGM